MLVKNTIIALMAVAPALSIPVVAPVKSASTVATTKATTKATVGTKATAANPASQRVSKAAVSKAESNVDRDVAAEQKLRAQMKAADARLLSDTTSARKLEKAEFAQEKADKALRKSAMKIKTPASKLAKTLNKSLHLHSTHHSKTNALTKNKHNLRISTHNHHSTGPRTPGSSKLTTPGSTRTSKLTGVSTPGSGFPNALGTGQSQYQSPYQSPYGGGFYGVQNGFQSPMSGRFRDTENISYTPTTGGGYKESISWGQKLARRAVVAPTTPTTPTTPVSPISPLAALLQKHNARKSSKLHQHTIAETMQLSQLLTQAEKVVNGLEAQMNKPQTVFHNLKRKSALKRLRVPQTPVTPATPATPSAVKST